MTTRLAAAIVMGYPRPWRERYEAEVLDLIGSTAVGWSDLIELARGLFVEKAKSIIEPGNGSGRVAIVLVAITFGITAAVGVGLSSIATAIGDALVREFVVAPRPALRFFPELVIQCLAFFFLMECSQWSRRDQSEAPLSPRTGLVLMAVNFVAVVLAAWLGSSAWEHWVWKALPGIVMADMLIQRSWPARIMLSAFRQLGTANHGLRWAQMELDRCQNLINAGSSAPFESAKAEMDRMLTMKDDALGQLNALGYRAKFAQGHVSI